MPDYPTTPDNVSTADNPTAPEDTDTPDDSTGHDDSPAILAEHWLEIRSKPKGSSAGLPRTGDLDRPVSGP